MAQRHKKNMADSVKYDATFFTLWALNTDPPQSSGLLLGWSVCSAKWNTADNDLKACLLLTGILALRQHWSSAQANTEATMMISRHFSDGRIIRQKKKKKNLTYWHLRLFPPSVCLSADIINPVRIMFKTYSHTRKCMSAWGALFQSFLKSTLS